MKPKFEVGDVVLVRQPYTYYHGTVRYVLKTGNKYRYIVKFTYHYDEDVIEEEDLYSNRTERRTGYVDRNKVRL